MNKSLLVGWDWDYENFTADEFGHWSYYMNRYSVYCLQELRSRHAAPIHISPVPGALGRANDSKSMHNILATAGRGVVAIDVFPESKKGGPIRCTEQTEVRQFCADAKAAGFRGIGVYTDTFYKGVRWTMVHIDTRIAVDATWGRVDGNYTTLEAALRRLENG